MSRSFGLVGLPHKFKSLKETMGLVLCGSQSFKEYFYSDGYSFKEYRDKNGKVYEEFEAGTSWASGPDLYLGLREKVSKNVVCTWTPSQMGYIEDIQLPLSYKEKTLTSEFIKEETGPMAFGYCPLYVRISDRKIKISQSQSKNSYEEKGIEISLINPNHGPLIRDWLTQQGFKIEELHDSK